MTITAKFSTICPCCNGRIEVGSKVEWSKGSKARHVSCAGGSSTAARPSRRAGGSTRSLYRRRYGWDGVEGSSSYYSSGLYDEES